MEIKIFYARDNEGRPAYLPVVHIFALGTENYISGLEDEFGNSRTNPFTGTAAGVIAVGAPDGEYTMRVVASGRTEERYVQFLDASANIALTEAYKNQAAAEAVNAGLSADAAASSAAEATAVVFSGDMSLTPTAAKVPLALSNGQIHPAWIQGAVQPIQAVDNLYGTTGLVVYDNANLEMQPQMFQLWKSVFIPAVLTAEIVLYRDGVNGIFITTDKKIRINCGGYYESEPLTVSDDYISFGLSRNDNGTNSVTVVFMHNGVQLGSTIVQASSDLYALSLFAADEGFYILASPGHAMNNSTGTLRINNPADAVGLAYDLSVNARNGSQATAAARPLMGRVPLGGRKNLIYFSEDPTNVTHYNTNNMTLALGGGSYQGSPFYEATETATNTNHVSHQLLVSTISISAGTYNFSTVVKKKGRRYVGLTFQYNGGNGGVAQFDLDTLALTYTGEVGGVTAIANEVITQLEPGVFRLSADFTLDASMVAGGGIGVAAFDSIAVSPMTQVFLGDVTKGFYATRLQISSGSGLKDYQKTLGARDATQSGIPDVWFHYFDRADDVLAFTVPAITAGTIVLAGMNGIWIDSLTVSAGTFNLGATAYTGSPAGAILALVGDVIGCYVIDKALSAPEKAALITLFKAKGAPGYFELGAELSPGGGTFDSNVGWLESPAGVISGGNLNMTPTFSECYPTDMTLVQANSVYLVQFEITASTAVYGLRLLNKTNNTGNYLLSDYLAAVAAYRYVVTSVHLDGSIGFQRFGHDGNLTVSYLSVKKLTLNTGA